MMKKESYKKDILRRLKISEGHLKKISQMVEEDKYCIDILQQTSAVKSAISKAEELILKNHLQFCITNAFKRGRTEKEIQELMNVFKKTNK